MNLEQAPTTQAHPFPHFEIGSFLTPPEVSTLQTWLAACGAWKLSETEFYEQFEFSVRDVQLPAEIEAILGADSVANIRRMVSEAFGVQLQEPVEVVAHRLDAGQRIRIHNDALPDAETHRFVLLLSDSTDDADGGILMLFSSAKSTDLAKLIRPIAGNGFGFEISQKSHHAVSTIHTGPRYSVVFSFRKEPRDSEN